MKKIDYIFYGLIVVHNLKYLIPPEYLAAPYSLSPLGWIVGGAIVGAIILYFYLLYRDVKDKKYIQLTIRTILLLLSLNTTIIFLYKQYFG